MRGNVGLADAVAADQLVERGQCRGELRAADELGVPHGQMRVRSAPVRTVFESQSLRQPQRVDVHLPARGAVRERRRPEDVGIAVAGALHLGARPRGVGASDAVLPAHVVPGVDACLEPGIARRPHDVGRPPADVGARQHRAIEQCPDAVMPDHRGASHLAEEAGAEDTPYRAPRVVGTEREQERRVGTVLLQEDDEIGHALARAAQRVDVDLQCQEHREPRYFRTGAPRDPHRGSCLVTIAITRRAAVPPRPGRCRHRRCG